MRQSKTATNKISVVTNSPALMIGLLFVFLAIRNWRLLLLTDVYDGFVVKTNLVAGGFNFENIKHFAKHTVFGAYDQHFIPFWFMLFFLFVWLFDTNRWIQGVLSYGTAACLLYLLFRIINYFYGKQPNGRLFSLIAVLLFSSSIFFLEAIAWKWQLVLLMSSVFYLLAVVIVLEKKHSLIWQVVYSLSLLAAIWTFSTYWIGVWGLAIFILLRNRGKINKVLLLTALIAFLGTITQVLANTNSIHTVNFAYMFVNIPAFLTVETANILMLTGGVFRFSAISQTYLSGVLSLTVIALLTSKYYLGYRSKKFTERDALIVSLLIVYILLLALSLLRIMPASGIGSSSDLESYVFGNRYLFIYSIPLFLIVAIALGSYARHLSRLSLYILLSGSLLLGIATTIIYPRFDPFITNQNRDSFYNLTPPALKEAHDKKLTLPNLRSDLFFKGQLFSLSQAVNVRKESPNYRLDFKDPSDLSRSKCNDLHKSVLVSKWLNLYNQNWCT